MEPAVHVQVGGVIQRPLSPHRGSHSHRNEVDRQACRQNQEAEDAALLGTAGQLIDKNEPHKNQQPSEQLPAGVFAVDLKQHTKFLRSK